VGDGDYIGVVVLSHGGDDSGPLALSLDCRDCRDNYEALALSTVRDLLRALAVLACLRRPGRVEERSPFDSARTARRSVGS
jgi:hypothetical protein